jgi:tripartite-type tricarboxylate transporter receptor subunit TctC
LTTPTNPFLFKKLNWDPIRDFVPIGLAIEAPHVIVTRKDLPVGSLQELIAYAKGASRRAQLCLAGQRLDPAHRYRAAAAAHRHGDGAHPL